MNKQKILDALKAGENIYAEFKESKNNLSKTLFETICAFLNTKGGTVYLGVNDNGIITGVEKEKISQSKKDNGRNYKGFNFFDTFALLILLSVLKGQFNISGFRNSDIRKLLPALNSGQISRLFKRLYKHGLIKKVGRTYKYYITKMGKEVFMTALKLKETVLIPALNY